MVTASLVLRLVNLAWEFLPLALLPLVGQLPQQRPLPPASRWVALVSTQIPV